MNIGYACKTIGVPNANIKSCIKRNATKEKLYELIAQNLAALNNIIDYNIRFDIRLFRISSDIISFGSNPINTLDWSQLFEQTLYDIGCKIKLEGIRVSMHPGQYTVLNSPNSCIVKNAIDDLAYHAQFLDSLGAGTQSKIVLHIGGAYDDKKASINRFILHYKYLPEKIKRRLVIENDDTCYNIYDVLKIGTKLKIPVIYDNLHNAVNACDVSKSDYFWTDACKKTWSEIDGAQKIHYSQQHPKKKAGSHSETIRINEFLSFYKDLTNLKPDIMLEVKDKNLSAIKCINCVSDNKNVIELEKEWNLYKYTILEHSPEIYSKTKHLLYDKKSCSAVEFYTLLEEALALQPEHKNSLSAAMHIWEHLKDTADEKETKTFFNAIQKSKEYTSVQRIKNILLKLSQKYNELDLLKSYYFYL